MENNKRNSSEKGAAGCVAGNAALAECICLQQPVLPTRTSCRKDEETPPVSRRRNITDNNHNNGSPGNACPAGTGDAVGCSRNGRRRVVRRHVENVADKNKNENNQELF